VPAVIGRWSTLVVVATAAVIAGVIAGSGDSDTVHPTLAVTIRNQAAGPEIPAGFVGLSLEYPAVLSYAGHDPAAINPAFEQLVRDISPGQAPQLRIGGDSTDRTWWPVPGMARPGGVRYNLTARWASVTGALARSLGARLILGINMEAGSGKLAAYEARALVSHIGVRSIQALELGNEPELYSSFPWYQSHGHGVNGRPRNYGPPNFTREFSRVAKSMPDVPLAGPATGAPRWMAYLPRFLRAAPHLRLVTMHRYATRGCFVSRDSPQYHTIANLLSVAATGGLAASVAPYARLGVPARIDELNSVNCGGTRGVSDRYASALWALDTLFELARVGVSGVNFHTFPGARYEPFSFRRAAGAWQASVKPLYYGILMFAQAAAPGSKLLAGSGHIANGLDVWALRAPDNRVRVALINFGAARTIALHLPAAAGPATIERLQAPALDASSGVAISGRSAVASGNGSYALRLPAASAALLTAARG
jgi:hypothetical protein